MMLLKKRWRDAKDDSRKSNCRKIESKKGIITNWNIKYKMVSHQGSKKHSLNKTVTETVQTIGSTRPTYGTRRMAAAVSRELKTELCFPIPL